MLGRQSCPLKWRPSSFTQYINGRTVSREDNVPTQMVGSTTIDVNWARCCHSMIFRRTFFLKRSEICHLAAWWRNCHNA